MTSSDKINNLLKAGKIPIFGENQNQRDYIQIGLEKLLNDWEIDFEGFFNVKLLITRTGPWIIDISPHNEFVVNFIRNKKQTNAQIYSYPGCMQIIYPIIYYQISYNN